MNDKSLQIRVAAELAWDPRIDAAGIGVAANDGIITLSGAVKSYAEKHNAEALALRVRGVHGIAEGLEVRPFGDLGIKDDEIAKRALSTLEWDVMVPDEKLKLVVEDGYITLTGEVDWDFQRIAAARALRGLSGVRDITNDITLKLRVQSEDIHRLIRNALERQGRIEADDIKVSVDGGKVSLKGKVKAWPDRTIIERAVWSTAGVYAVDDQVTVAA